MREVQRVARRQGEWCNEKGKEDIERKGDSMRGNRRST